MRIGRAEVVAPFRDAVGFVYRDASEFTLRVDGLEMPPERICERIFGRYVKQASQWVSLPFGKIQQVASNERTEVSTYHSRGRQVFQHDLPREYLNLKLRHGYWLIAGLQPDCSSGKATVI